MAARRPTHADHSTLRKFCRDPSPFVQQSLWQVTEAFRRLSILLTAKVFYSVAVGGIHRVHPSWSSCLFQGSTWDNFYHQNDTATPHYARTETTFLQQQGITKMDQTADSSGWNPSDYLWGKLRLVVGRVNNLSRVWVSYHRLCWIIGPRSLQNAHNARWPACAGRPVAIVTWCLYRGTVLI